MELPISHKGNPLLRSSFSINNDPRKLTFFQLPTKSRPKFCRKRLTFRASSSGNSSNSNGFSWKRLVWSLRVGSEQFWSNISESVKKENGFDLDEANMKLSEFGRSVKEVVKKGEGEFARFRTELVPEFVSWNRWERWKDYKNWESERIAALVLYIFVAIFSCQRLYVAV